MINKVLILLLQILIYNKNIFEDLINKLKKIVFLKLKTKNIRLFDFHFTFVIFIK